MSLTLVLAHGYELSLGSGEERPSLCFCFVKVHRSFDQCDQQGCQNPEKGKSPSWYEDHEIQKEPLCWAQLCLASKHSWLKVEKSKNVVRKVGKPGSVLTHDTGGASYAPTKTRKREVVVSYRLSR